MPTGLLKSQADAVAFSIKRLAVCRNHKLSSIIAISIVLDVTDLLW